MDDLILNAVKELLNLVDDSKITIGLISTLIFGNGSKISDFLKRFRK